MLAVAWQPLPALLGALTPDAGYVGPLPIGLFLVVGLLFDHVMADCDSGHRFSYTRNEEVARTDSQGASVSYRVFES